MVALNTRFWCITASQLFYVVMFAGTSKETFHDIITFPYESMLAIVGNGGYRSLAAAVLVPAKVLV